MGAVLTKGAQAVQMQSYLRYRGTFAFGRSDNILSLPQRAATPIRLGENNRSNQRQLHKIKFYIENKSIME